MKDTAVSGLYDAIVVHADHSAVPFFKKYGFSDDLILNSKWAYVFQSFSITSHKGRSTSSTGVLITIIIMHLLCTIYPG